MGHNGVYEKLRRRVDKHQFRAPYNENLHAMLKELYSTEEADLIVKMPYGMSHILSDSPTAILPASKDNVMTTQFFAMKEHLPQAALDRFVEIGVAFDDAVPLFTMDLIGFHEIGHIYTREYGTWPTEKWLSEYIATYLAYAFMTEVAFHIERQNHHPKWTNMYNKVEIELTTHDAGDTITEKDWKLADSIEAVYERFHRNQA